MRERLGKLLFFLSIYLQSNWGGIFIPWRFGGKLSIGLAYERGTCACQLDYGVYPSIHLIS